jgi:hypothetical protein
MKNRQADMLYVDYNWDLSPTLMIPDEELNTDWLQWKKGDYWKVVENSKGRKMLLKVDELEAFLLTGTTENIDNNKKRE